MSIYLHVLDILCIIYLLSIVSMYLYLSVYLSVCPCIYLLIYLSTIYLSVCLSVYLFICLCVRLRSFLAIHPSIHLYNYLTTFIDTYLPTSLVFERIVFIILNVHLPACPLPAYL